MPACCVKRNKVTMRHNQRVYAEFVESPMKPRFTKFDNIQLCDIGISWSIVVMVDIKFPIQSHSDSQRSILKDDTGSKIEAVVRGDDTGRFNRLLTQGCSYTIHEVRFQKSAMGTFRNCQNLYECRLDPISVVEPDTKPVVFAQYPKHLMSFDGVFQCPENTYTYISGIVVHWGDVQRVGSDRLRYREMILMDTKYDDRCNIWRLKTSDHTVFEFNPTHSLTSELKALQQALHGGAVDFNFVKIFVEKQGQYLANEI